MSRLVLAADKAKLRTDILLITNNLHHDKSICNFYFSLAFPLICASMTDRRRASFTLSSWLPRDPRRIIPVSAFTRTAKKRTRSPAAFLRVGSAAQVAYVPRCRASERVRDRMNRTFAKMEKQSLWERAVAAAGSLARPMPKRDASARGMCKVPLSIQFRDSFIPRREKKKSCALREN
ncbi:hypothetical protein PUN28_011735 [Cardiocondyla obscurior]|uniref:Uncharacterized protein n=1 Tax=Cardiocondyla obscurior TaxID=286306 RepID=A0AAW2FGP2_9HYME